MTDLTRPSTQVRARLLDVAKAAGVSIVTVSRAMNAPASVSAKTHDRIEAAMRAVDYVPDLAARSLAKQRSGIVAAFVPNLLDPIFIDMIRGLESVFGAQGIHLLIGGSGYDLEREEAIVVAALGRRLDGLILTGTSHTDRLRRLVAGSGTPVIETWDILGQAIDRAVGYDQRAAGFALTRHLIDSGYRRIGYVGRPVRGNGRATAKRDGFVAALENAGRHADPALMLECETTMSAGLMALEKLHEGAGADAIVFSGDAIAAGTCLACLNRGVRVPEDLALCGFGDYEIARLLPGGLTTISADSAGIGALAAQAILDIVAGKSPQWKTLDTGFELIVRGSTRQHDT